MTVSVGSETRRHFEAAIAMAEAAECGNMSWWGEIRSAADDPAEIDYFVSVLLAKMITAGAHRDGLTSADVWAHIRRTGDLPL